MPRAKNSARFAQKSAVYAVRELLFRRAGQLLPIVPITNRVLNGLEFANEIFLLGGFVR